MYALRVRNFIELGIANDALGVDGKWLSERAISPVCRSDDYSMVVAEVKKK